MINAQVDHGAAVGVRPRYSLHSTVTKVSANRMRTAYAIPPTGSVASRAFRKISGVFMVMVTWRIEELAPGGRMEGGRRAGEGGKKRKGSEGALGLSGGRILVCSWISVFRRQEIFILTLQFLPL